jgi:hypothetical protein
MAYDVNSSGRYRRLGDHEVRGGRHRGDQDEQHPLLEVQPAAFAERNQRDSRERHRDAGPTPHGETLAEERDGHERGEDRPGRDDEARRAGAHALLAEVERDVVDGDAEDAREHDARHVLPSRQAHADDEGVRREHDGGHAEA